MRLRSYIRKIALILNRAELKKAVWLGIANTFVSIADIGFLAALLYVVHFYIGGNQHAGIVPPGGGSYFNRHPIVLIICFLGLFGVKNLLAYLSLRAQFNFVFGVAGRLASGHLMAYLSGDYHDFVDIDSAVLVRRISQQPIEFSQYILAALQQMITELALISFALFGILLYDAKLFLVLFAILLPAVWIVSIISRKRLKQVRDRVKHSGELALQYLQEALKGFVESNIYQRNAFFTARFGNAQQTLNGQLAQLQITQAIPSRMVEVFAILGLLLLIWAAEKFHSPAEPALWVTLAAFIAASYKIIPGIVRLSNLAGQVRTFDFTIDGILSQQAAFKRPDILQPVDRIGAFAVKDLSYEIGGRVILDKINLQIRAGEFIGISGGSGSGKSTLLNLVTGFLKPAGGETLINGNGIGDNMRYAYQSRMAYVKQQPYLLHDTVVSNICMGLPINWDRLNELMKVCGIKGYEDFQSETAGSLIAENGRNISGGERQRICFARALYKDSDLLVLDEAFSELDQRAEHQLLNHCRQIAKSGKLVVMVTHNQQSLTFCDRTYNIDQMNQLEEN